MSSYEEDATNNLIPYEETIRQVIDSELSSKLDFLQHLGMNLNQRAAVIELMIEAGFIGLELGLSINPTSIVDELGIYLRGVDDATD